MNKQTNIFEKWNKSFYRFYNHLIPGHAFSTIYSCRKVKVCTINVRIVVCVRIKFKCSLHSIPKWMITNWWLQMRTACQIQYNLMKQTKPKLNSIARRSIAVLCGWHSFRSCFQFLFSICFDCLAIEKLTNQTSLIWIDWVRCACKEYRNVCVSKFVSVWVRAAIGCDAFTQHAQ